MQQLWVIKKGIKNNSLSEEWKFNIHLLDIQQFTNGRNYLN